MLTFDEPTHTYFWHGQKVPNVTRIIGHLTDYSHIPADALARAQEEGKAVHKMVELDCGGKLDVSALPEWMRPHYAAWQKFLAESGFEPWLSEHRLFHPVQRYAGTLDLVGETKHLKRNGVWLIDVKRSLYAGPAIGLQLAGYDTALRADKAMPKPERRAALRLGRDGKYHLDEFEDREDYSAFLACLQQHRWREKHYGSR